MTKRWEINGLKDLPKVANELLAFAENHNFFVFYGEMGAGKTTLIKAIATKLGVVDSISSPTYGLVNEYSIPQATDKTTVFHMDLYRLKSVEELLDVGFEDYLDRTDSYLFIEWPQLATTLFPDKRVEIHLVQVSEHERILDVEIFD